MLSASDLLRANVCVCSRGGWEKKKKWDCNLDVASRLITAVCDQRLSFSNNEDEDDNSSDSLMEGVRKGYIMQVWSHPIVSAVRRVQEEYQKCGTSPRPSEPHEIWLLTSQTQAAHITQSKLKPATRSLFDSLLYNHSRWHCSRGLHVLLIPAHLSRPRFSWQCCISPARSGFCWCAEGPALKPVG